MNHDFQAAAQYVQALTGNPDTPMDWRTLHDTDKAALGHNLRGTLTQVWPELVAANAAGRGIFAVVNESDGTGRKLANITAVRAHFVDLDDVAVSNAMRSSALGWSLAPAFEVWSSPGKFHLYWRSERYQPGEHFGDVQRRLRTMFGGDESVVDATRVMRVPGFYHLKNPAAPVMVTLYAGPGYAAAPLPWSVMSGALAHITPPAGAGGTRSGLGDPRLAAPSLAEAVQALDMIDPDELQRDEWIKITAAFKQAVSTHTDDDGAFKAWSDWCARYEHNDVGENLKQWRDITDTKAGWKALLDRSGMRAALMFGNAPGVMPSVLPTPSGQAPAAGPVGSGQAPVTPVGEQFGTFLTPAEQARYFKGCVLITKEERILTPFGRFMGPGKFNATYGGKVFSHTEDGKTTDEAWKAVTRGQVYQVPKVDHIRFLPTEPQGAIIMDELGRKGINTYIPATIQSYAGDPTPFVEHLRRILPTEQDVLILLNYLARIVQSPGVKIPWAPVIQSVEGVGKNVLKFCMAHAIGSVYMYYPKATELAETGGKFNAWMRNRLLIICDEVKTDEKRNLIEALKDMVSEGIIQIQGKGADQDIEDNAANWIFFTNWEDAIPIDRKSRRWAIFYSKLQTELDLINAGMDAAYYNGLYDWIKTGGGKQIVAHYLQTFAIDPALDPATNQRAPKTSSYEAAIVNSRTAPEAAIIGAIEQQRPGFRAGWVSSSAIQVVLREAEVKASHLALGRILKGLGYAPVGRAPRGWLQEDGKQPNLWSTDANAQVGNYGRSQGYE